MLAPGTAAAPADPLRLRLMTITGLFGFAVTGAVVFIPSVHFAYYSPGFHIALETAAGLTAALAAFLFFGRLKHSRLQCNWALVYALLLSSAINLLLSAVPGILANQTAGEFAVWASAGGRLIAATALAFAAHAPLPWVTKGRHIGYSVVAGVIVTVGLVMLATFAAMPFVPTPIVETTLGATTPMLAAHPSIVIVHLLTMLLFTIASLGFIQRSDRTGDELMRWLAAGSLLAAFSRLHYVLFPSLYADWVSTGDFLRLGFYGLLLVGAVGEIRRYWRGLAEGAASDERRRIARDLHDGLAQELAYIAVQTRWMRNHGGDADTLRRVTASADRALDESRRAIAALTRSGDEPFDIALAQAAEEVADRVGANVRLELADVGPLTPETQENLVRIAREAIANAGSHSGSDEVLVRLSANGRVRLEVSDQGCGFRPEEAPADRYGLVSMRERAVALDAEFSVISSPGRGTTVEVALP